MNTLLPLRGAGTAASAGESVRDLQAAEWLDGRILYDRRHWRCDQLELNWRAQAHLLVLTEQGRTGETRVALDCGIAYAGRDRPGVISFIPASADRKAVYFDANLVFSAFWIDPALAETLSGVPAGELTPFVNAQDAVTGALIAALGREVANGCIPETAYVEHMAALCLLHAGKQRKRSNKQTRVRTLPPRRMAEIEAFIDANLSARISVSDLAALSSMTPDYFTRAFKATTGQPPYAFITSRRVERAKRLIADGGQPLSSIAYACGFVSQSHLTSVFRTHAGVTPRAFRALSSV